MCRLKPDFYSSLKLTSILSDIRKFWHPKVVSPRYIIVKNAKLSDEGSTETNVCTLLYVFLSARRILLVVKVCLSVELGVNESILSSVRSVETTFAFKKIVEACQSSHKLNEFINQAIKEILKAIRWAESLLCIFDRFLDKLSREGALMSGANKTFIRDECRHTEWVSKLFPNESRLKGDIFDKPALNLTQLKTSKS